MRTLVALVALLVATPAAADAPRSPCAGEDATLAALSSIDLKAISPACRRAVELRTAPARLVRHLEGAKLAGSLATVDACAFHPTWAVHDMIRGLAPEAGEVANGWCLVGLVETGLPAALAAVDQYLVERGLGNGQLDFGIEYALRDGIATAAFRARLLPVLRRAAATPHVPDRKLLIDAVCVRPLGRDVDPACRRARQLEAAERRAERPLALSACSGLFDRSGRLRSDAILRIAPACRLEVESWRAPTVLLRQLLVGYQTYDDTTRRDWLALLCAFHPTWAVRFMIAGLEVTDDEIQGRCLVGLADTGLPRARAAVDSYLAARGLDGGRVARAVRLPIWDEYASRAYRARLAPLLRRTAGLASVQGRDDLIRAVCTGDGIVGQAAICTLARANEMADEERFARERRLAEAERVREAKRRHRTAVIAAVVGSLAYGALSSVAPRHGIADAATIGGALAGATVAIALVHRSPTSDSPLARALQEILQLMVDGAVGVAGGAAGGVVFHALADGSPARRFAAGALAAGVFSTVIVRWTW